MQGPPRAAAPSAAWGPPPRGGPTRARPRHCRLDVGTARRVLRRYSLEAGGGDLEEAPLELLPLLSGEPRKPVAGLTPALDVGRFQRVDVAASAQDRLLDRGDGHPGFHEPRDRPVESVIRPRYVRIQV